MFDDFDTQVQIEEIIHEEYEDWLRFCESEHDEDPYADIDSIDDLFGEDF